MSRPPENAPPGSQWSCAVFYRPPLAFDEYTTSYALTREARFAKIAEHCVDAQRLQGLFNLSGLAACTFEAYPSDLSPDRTYLAKLRGVVAFLNYGSAGGRQHEVGAALPAGVVTLECFIIVFASSSIPPVNLCLAALLGSVEGMSATGRTHKRKATCSKSKCH